MKLNLKRLSYLLTFRTHQGALVLSLKQVDDHAIIAPHVSFPRLLCELHDFPIAPSFPVRFFYVRFFEDSIQILVQAIKQKGDKFLRVVLLIAAKLRSKTLKLLLKFTRGIG